MYIIVIALVVLAAAIVLYLNQPKFGRAPRGERLARIERSVNYRDGEFRNQEPTPQLTSGKGRARTMLDFLFEKRERNRPEAALPAVKTDLKGISGTDDVLVWFGHSSYLMQSDGKRILVDPVFEDAAPVSFFNKPFEGTDIYQAEDMPDIDYLVITHDHWDHLDHVTMVKLRERVKTVVCPLGVGEYFEQWGFDKGRLVELDWNEQADLGDGFTVFCLPSRHFSGRTFRANQTLWASFMFETPSRHVYFSGDGGYDGRFAEIARRFPYIDVAVMENGQYNKDWRYIHMMPEEQAKAIKDLKPRKVFSGHNGKYALAKHPWDEPLEHIAEVAERDSLNVVMPIIGERVFLNEPAKPVNRWWRGIR